MTVAELIGKEELTGQKMMEIYTAAYMDPHIDADGDVTIVLDGIKILVTVDTPRSVLRLVALFGVKAGVNRQQVLELANRINDGLIMLRASYPAALPLPSLMIDHYLVTERACRASRSSMRPAAQDRRGEHPAARPRDILN